MENPGVEAAECRPHAQRRKHWLVAAVLLLSFAVRLWNLNAPVVELNEFRQTQTASNVYWMLQEGMNPLRYQTPAFGPPWRLPMEFPTFQLTAALVAKTGLLGVDASCRLTNIAYFYLSALFLYLLCRRFLPTKNASLCIVGCYVWLPYTLAWSRTSMIDYASVAFGLGYLYWFLRWLEGDRRTLTAAAAILFGVLGYLSKVMSMTMIVLTLGCYLVWHMGQAVRQAGGLRGVCRTTWLRRTLPTFVVGSAMVLLPFFAGWQWIRYSDQVKSRTSLTEFFASTNPVQRPWNFSTSYQFFDAKNWGVVLERIRATATPGVLLLFPMATLIAVFRSPPRAAAFTLIIILAGMAQIAIHFNLYLVHDYYLMAVSPVLAVAVGYGVFCVFARVLRGQWWPRLVLATFIPISLALDGVAAYLRPSFGPEARHALEVGGKAVFGEFSRTLARVTRPEERIVLADIHWNSIVLYYAHRKGLMLWSRDLLDWPGVRETLKRPEFTTVAFADPFPELLSLWKHAEIVEKAGPFLIFRVGDKPLPPRSVRLQIDAQQNIAACAAMHDVEIRTDNGRLILRSTGLLPAIRLPEFDMGNASSLLVKVDMTSPCDTLMLFYYLTEGQKEYDNKQAVSAPAKIGRNTAYLKIPAQRLRGRLRFDPARCEGAFVLHELEIVAVSPQSPDQ